MKMIGTVWRILKNIKYFPLSASWLHRTEQLLSAAPFCHGVLTHFRSRMMELLTMHCPSEMMRRKRELGKEKKEKKRKEGGGGGERKRKLKKDLPYDPEILLLGTCPKEMKLAPGKDICTSMFTAELFTIAKIWK